MVKCLAFRLPDGGYGLVALRAVDRADYKIADGLGVRRADLKLASGDEIAGDLGMAPGDVAPLPINGATVVIDRRAAP
jgi:Cys-tRNA(Pro)/Cys-tRNA(Cys) deacylase